MQSIVDVEAAKKQRQARLLAGKPPTAAAAAPKVKVQPAGVSTLRRAASSCSDVRAATKVKGQPAVASAHGNSESLVSDKETENLQVLREQLSFEVLLKEKDALLTSSQMEIAFLRGELEKLQSKYEQLQFEFEEEKSRAFLVKESQQQLESLSADPSKKRLENIKRFYEVRGVSKDPIVWQKWGSSMEELKYVLRVRNIGRILDKNLGERKKYAFY